MRRWSAGVALAVAWPGVALAAYDLDSDQIVMIGEVVAGKLGGEAVTMDRAAAVAMGEAIHVCGRVTVAGRDDAPRPFIGTLDAEDGVFALVDVALSPDRDKIVINACAARGLNVRGADAEGQ